MDSKTRIELIRQGNEAFNAGDYPKARDLFTRASYSDGLIRLGDHYMYERRLPLLAYGYYRRAGATDKINDLHRRMVGAISAWIGSDKLKPEFQASMVGMAPGAAGSPTNPRNPGSQGNPDVSGGAASSGRRQYVNTDSDGMVRVPVNTDLLKQARSILGK